MGLEHYDRAHISIYESFWESTPTPSVVAFMVPLVYVSPPK